MDTKQKRKFNGRKLQEMRVNAGMNLADLAKRFDCVESAVSMWENGERTPQPRTLKKMSEFFKVPVTALFLSLLLFFSSNAYADVTRAQAIRAIVGEATGQGLDGMTAVGEVIRHLNSIKTMQGYKAMAWRREPESVWNMAGHAWDRSAHTNLTKGATLFENIYRFGFPKSWDPMKVVCVANIRDHWFFVEE